MSRALSTFLWLVVIAIIIAVAFLFYKGNLTTSTVSPTATTTGSQTTSNNSGNPGTSTIVDKADAPIVTTDPNVVPSNSTAVVSGHVTPNGDLAYYWFDYGLTSSLGNRSNAQAVGSGYKSIPSPGYITGLRPNTLYYFRLSAKNKFGTVNGSTYTFTTNTENPPEASAPDVNTNPVTGISRTSVNLNGRVNPNGSETTYWFEYGKDTTLGKVTEFKSAGSGKSGTAVSISLSSLNPVTKYYFRLNAQNQYGTVNGSIQSFTTIGPAAPGVPTVSTSLATNVSSSTAVLNGKLNPNGDDTIFSFQYGTDPNLNNIIDTVTPDNSPQNGTASLNITMTLANLSPSTKYYYRLVGNNQYGIIQGNIVSFQTKK